MNLIEQCIYCGINFDPFRGEGDHVIPCQLGEFRGDQRFRRVCQNCNTIIGQSEQQIVQSGPEGFFRGIIKPKSKRLNKRGLGRPQGAMGAPPPQHMAKIGVHQMLVEPTPGNPLNVNSVDHIFVQDVAGNNACIQIFPGMRAGQVRKSLISNGIGEMKEVHCSFSEQYWDEFTSLLKEIWPESKLEEGDAIPAGTRKVVPGRIKFQVNTHYFQAIAKIAFHYFLIYTHRGFKGNESHFDAIRQFIIKGGIIDQFFKSTKFPMFVLPFGDLLGGGVISPKQWCHIIAASDAGGQAVAYVHLFLGRGCIPVTHKVWLGRWDSPIITPNNAWGHVYIYDDPQHGRYAGRVESIQITSNQW